MPDGSVMLVSILAVLVAPESTVVLVPVLAHLVQQEVTHPQLARPVLLPVPYAPWQNTLPGEVLRAPVALTLIRRHPLAHLQFSSVTYPSSECF
jgi:hypothetical protein